jgi:cytochrome c1
MRAALALLCALFLTGCLRDLDPRLGERHSVAGGKAKEGPAAMREYGCGSCHTIPGVRGAHAKVAPPLAAWKHRRFIAGRVPNTPDELVRWIIHPQGIKPGTAMPDMGVTDQDARHIAAYLYTLEK